MAGNNIPSDEDTPGAELRKHKNQLIQSQRENEALKKQLQELQSATVGHSSNSGTTGDLNSKKKQSDKSLSKKGRKRVYVIESSDSNSQSDSSCLRSSVSDKSDSESGDKPKKKKIKRSKTVISRSTNNIETPTMKSGMKYPDWVHWVNVWQHSIKIPKKDQAMLLLQALPIQSERFGNIQKLVTDNLGIEENIKCSKGVENIIRELDKLYKEEEFPALITFMRKWEPCHKKLVRLRYFFKKSSV